MKKTLLILASAALLLVGCAKEQIVDLQEGEMTNVTFTANLESGVVTKASADNDGVGTNVNRCIMEIYFKETCYKRLVQTVETVEGKKVATFANVPVVAGKEYQILFWADYGSGTEGKDDLYYATDDLKTVTVKGAFIDALQSGNNDKLDAFFGNEKRTFNQQNDEVPIQLKRPFAQLNVITTDVATDKAVISADLLPEKVSVKYKAANIINVATGEVSGNVDYEYEASVYGKYDTWNNVKSRGELTLSMDYIFAEAEKRVIDVTFKTKNGKNVVMTHNLTNLPYQRNYRTNVKGDLLTVGGTWKATIEPNWSNPDIVKVVEVADIKSANEIINQYKETTDHLEVKFTAEPNDSGKPTGEPTSPSRAIVTTPIKEESVLSIEVLAQTKSLYVGDYTNEYTVTSVDTEHAKHAVVNINVPESSSIVTLVINAPSKSVYINGKAVANVGTITDLDAITSQNTLIIEKGQTVNKLTIRQGGLEIHGTVEKVIVPSGHGEIAVRDCENLNEKDVYDVLKGHIAEGYVGVLGRTTPEKWDIVPVICKINDTYYGSLADAVAAVPATGTETTITMVANHEILGNAGVTVAAGQNIILDLACYTVKNLVNESKASQIITNKGTLKITGNGTLTNALADGVIPGDWPTYNYVTNLITNSGVLTIENGVFSNTQDSGITYTIDNVSNESVAAIATINGGTFKSVGNSAVRMFCNSTTAANTLTINDGFFEGHYYAVSVSNAGNGTANTKVGTLNVNGGEFESLDEAEHYNACIANWQSNKSTNIAINIAGGKFNDYVLIASNASVTGGLFKHTVYTDPDDGTQYKLADYVAEKYDLTENTDEATKAEYPWTVERKHVAMIGSTKYYTLADAVADVPTNGTETTITMIADHEILGNAGVTVAATQNIILDLAGYTVKNLVNENKASQVILNKGKLKIIDTAGDGLITNAAAEGTQTGEWWSTPQYNYVTNIITNNGDLTIDGANLHETATSSICYAIDNNSNGVDATCTIKSGHISTLASTAIRMFCNSTTKMNTINVKGGLIEGGYTGIWLQLPGNGQEKKKAKLNISGGTLKGGTYAWYDYTYGDLFDEVKVTISGGLLDGGIFSYGTNIDISGGVFTSDVNIKQTKPSTISVTGGKFSGDVDAYGDSATKKFISGGLFKINTFEYQQQYYYCNWTDKLVDGKSYVELTESDPEYADGYRFKVVDQAQ